jgi:DNA polymerase
MAYLQQQIEKQKPKFAFRMENTAVQWFLGDKDIEVKNLIGTWNNVRGLHVSITYHPLAVRRRPKLLR